MSYRIEMSRNFGKFVHALMRAPRAPAYLVCMCMLFAKLKFSTECVQLRDNHAMTTCSFRTLHYLGSLSLFKSTWEIPQTSSFAVDRSG